MIERIDLDPQMDWTFSTCVIAGDYVYTAHVAGYDGQANKWPDSVAEQTEQCFHNLEKVLGAAQTTLDDVVKTTVYLKDIADFDEMRRFSDIFNVIDNSGQPVRCHKNGGRGYISGTVAAYPKHDIEVWKLLEAGRYDEAQAKLDGVSEILGPVRAKIGQKSGGYRFGKGLAAALGQPVGPPRPPTLAMDEQEIAELREVVKELGWLNA